jgi:hypothetical protein
MTMQSMLQGMLKKALRLSVVPASLLILAQLAPAQESATFEKIRDTSPDKKFAVRISCGSEPEDAQEIPSEDIKAIELISLPSKRVVAKLLPSDDVDTDFEDITLVWSPDSKWCAFYYSAPRVGYTTVLRQSGAKFKVLNKGAELMAHVEGEVRDEHIRPTKWIKPGVLVLEQLTVLQGDEDVKLELTAGLDPKTGKFKLLSKKKIPADSETEKE